MRAAAKRRERCRYRTDMADSIRPDSIDPLFTQPYVDVDEWRDVPVRHRYVHGGFADTETRFSIYFPPTDAYEGRFFQHITPVPDSEHLAQGATGEQDRIGFSISSGGYFLETNGGGASGQPGSRVDPTIAAYRANAAAAEYSRVVAAQMYGEHRPYGYAYGGSGGGYRTIGSAENTSGVWDGFVPYVIGSSMAIPNMFTVRMHAQRILRDRFDQIVDGVEPGGSGDMFEGLDAEERDALTEVTRMGFPPRSWFGHRTMGMHAFPVLYRGLVAADPTFFEDFWTKPGYLGHDLPPSLQRDRVTEEFELVSFITEGEASLRGLPGKGTLARHAVASTPRGAGLATPHRCPPGSGSRARRPSTSAARICTCSPARRRGRGSASSPSSTTSPCSVPARTTPSSSCGPATRSASTTAGISRPRPTIGTRCPRAVASTSGTNSGTRTVRRATRRGPPCSDRCSPPLQPDRSNQVVSRER